MHLTLATSRLAAATAAVAVSAWGCAPAPEVQYVDAEVVHIGAQDATFRMIVREKDASWAKRYHTQYTPGLDWQIAKGQFLNQTTGITYASQANATLGAGNTRTAAVNFKVAAGTYPFTVTLNLMRTNRLGALITLATGSATGTSISSGANTIAVPLTLTALGLNALNVSLVSIPVTVSTVVGLGYAGSGHTTTVTADRLNAPHGVTFDGTNLFIADTFNNQLTKWLTGTLCNLDNNSNQATTPGNSGSSTTNLTYQPTGLALGTGPKLYFCDTGNNTIRVATPSTSTWPCTTSTYASFAGPATFPGPAGFLDGTTTAARFSNPRGIASDLTNFFVADTDNHVIRGITSAGVTTTICGNGGILGNSPGLGTAAFFNKPSALAYFKPAATAFLFVADTNNHLIRKVQLGGTVTAANTATSAAFAGSTQGFEDGPAATAQFNQPAGVAVDTAGNVYVADTGNNAIRRIDTNNIVTTLAGSGNGTAGYLDSATPLGLGLTTRFSAPVQLYVNGAGTLLYVADSGNHCIRQISL